MYVWYASCMDIYVTYCGAATGAGTLCIDGDVMGKIALQHIVACGLICCLDLAKYRWDTFEGFGKVQEPVICALRLVIDFPQMTARWACYHARCSDQDKEEYCDHCLGSLTNKYNR